MEDIISILGIWGIAIIAGLVGIRRTKGVDWYSPITSRHKMIMTLLNVSGLTIVITIFYKYLVLDIKKYVIITVIIIAIFSLVLFGNVINVIVKKIKKIQKDSSDERKTLNDLFMCFLTIFNVFYLLMSIGYLCYILNRHESEFEAGLGITEILKQIFVKDNFLIPLFSFVLYSLFIGTIVTSTGWLFKDSVDSEIINRNKDTGYATKRVNRRGRR